MTRFITTHILTALPLHNLNRDQNGMPKSTIDGDVHRARLSAQSIKRGARVAFRDRGDSVGSIRTRNAAAEIVKSANDYASRNGIDVDPKKVAAKAKDLVAQLVNKDDVETDVQIDDTGKVDTSEASKGSKGKKKPTILFFSQAEIDTVAGAIVDSLNGGDEATLDDFIRDSSSPSLDVAAFGRMFAKEQTVSTLASVAVSHSVTTHEMNLTSDYFSAVEDGAQEHAGGGHLGMSFYTSGTYYRSFTIDVDQLARSWSNFGAPSARDELAALVRSLITALPRGRTSNSAPNVPPHTVLVETQSTRTAYGFEEPVQAGEDGGLADRSAERLAQERKIALKFDGSLFGPAKVYTRTPEVDFQAEAADGLADLVEFIVDSVYEGRSA